VVRPPTARSVSATADAGVSAGWQHRNNKRSVSSRSSTSGWGCTARCPRGLGLHRPLLAAPPCLFAAIDVGHPPARGLQQPAARVVRYSVALPVLGRRDPRLLYGVLGRAEVAVPADHHAEDLRRQLAQQIRDGAGSGHSSLSMEPITWRTSIRCRSGTPPRPGAEDTCAAISTARSSDSTSTSWQPASTSFALG